MNILRWIKGLFKKKQPEKIRIVIRDGKFVMAKIPEDYIYHVAAINQRVECYRAKLNGTRIGFIKGLGAFS